MKKSGDLAGWGWRTFAVAGRRARRLAAQRHGNDEEAAEGTGGEGRPGRVVLTEGQLAALEKAKADKEAHGEFESECPGYCGAQDTFYVGNMKGVGRIYQQTFVDTYSKVAFAKLYERKTPITAADLLNDRVVPPSSLSMIVPWVFLLPEISTERRLSGHATQHYVAK